MTEYIKAPPKYLRLHLTYCRMTTPHLFSRDKKVVIFGGVRGVFIASSVFTEEM